MIETRPDLQDLLNEPYRLTAIMEEEVTKMIESHLTAKEAKAVAHELKRRVWQHEFGLPPRRCRLDVHEELSSPVVSDIDSDRDIDLPSLTPVPGTYPIQTDDLRTPSPGHVFGGSTFKVPSSDTDSDISPTPSSQDSDDDKENEPPASYSPIPFNVDFVLDNLDLRRYFKAIVSADDVRHSKPDPETFLKAAQLLNLKPGECVVFEDAPKGVEAAANAGMAAVVLTTMHGSEEFLQYNNVLGFVKDYTDQFVKEFLGKEEVSV